MTQLIADILNDMLHLFLAVLALIGGIQVGYTLRGWLRSLRALRGEVLDEARARAARQVASGDPAVVLEQLPARKGGEP